MIKCLLASILALICFGCVYSPDEEPFTKIQPPSLNSTINLTGVSPGSVIPINKKEYLSFTVSPSGRKKYILQVYIDDQLKYSNESSFPEFTFEVDPAKFSDGLKDLRVMISHSSGNGSLADNLGAEMVMKEQNWKILIDTQPPAAVSGTKVEILDGRLMISWNKPSKENFSEYDIIRTYLRPNNVTIRDTLKVKDNKAVNLHDAFYVGGKVTYQVDLKAYKFYVKGSPVQFDCVPLAIVFHPDSVAPYFDYSQSILYNNSLTIEWYRPSLFKTTSPLTSGTVVVDNIKFGETIPYKARILQKVADARYKTSYDITNNAYLGYRTQKNRSRVFYSKTQNSYYFLNYDGYKTVDNATLYKIDGNTKQAVDSLVFSSFQPKLLMSQNENHTYILSNNNLLQKIDLATLTIIENIDVYNLTGDNVNSGNYGITNDNLFYFTSDDAWQYILNLNNRTILWYKMNSQGGSVYVSPDGQLMVQGSQLFKRTAAGFAFYAKLLHPYSSVNFKQNNHIIFFDAGTARVFDPNAPLNVAGGITPYLVKSGIYLPSYYYLDYHTNTISADYYISNYARDFNIYDVNTFDLKSTRREAVENNQSGIQHVNGFLFHAKGYYISVR